MLDPSVTEADRLEAKAGRLHARLQDPNMLLRVAKHEGRVVGWIAWTKPKEERVPYNPPRATYKADVETDFALREEMLADKEKKRGHFVGNRPTWRVILRQNSIQWAYIVSDM